MPECLYQHCANFAERATETCSEECLANLLHKAAIQNRVQCSDCASMLHVASNKSATRCDHPHCRDMATGWPVLARLARAEKGRCGPAGQHFSPKKELLV